MSEHLEKLRKQREQLDARIKQAETREKERARKHDTRRKILLGALLVDWVEKDDGLRDKVTAHLDRFLTRKMDRELFGLAPLPAKSGDEEAKQERSSAA